MTVGKSLRGLAILATLWTTGCATNAQEQLKPPSVHVYRQPQIWVTHTAPTETVMGLSAAEDGSQATPTLEDQPPAWPTMTNEEYEQYLADDIENLLTKMENRLDNTNVNP